MKLEQRDLGYTLLFISCNSQTETYWNAYDVFRINKEPITGFTLTYMENIHIRHRKDSLEFHYPFQKKIKSSELKSLMREFPISKDIGI